MVGASLLVTIGITGCLSTAAALVLGFRLDDAFDTMVWNTTIHAVCLSKVLRMIDSNEVGAVLDGTQGVVGEVGR